MNPSRLATDLINKPLADGKIILVPNHQTREAILYGYANSRHQIKAWPSPQVFAIDIWLQNYWQKMSNQARKPFNQLHLLGKQEEAFIWLKLLEASIDSIPLLNTSDTAIAVSRAYQLAKQWQIRSPAISAYSGISDVTAFLHWSDQFAEYCQTNQLISLSDATEKIVTDLEQGNTELKNEIYLLGFSNPPPLYQKLFDSLPRTTLLANLNNKPSNSTPDTTRYSFADMQTEVTACAKWARDITDKSPAAHIGIVCEDLTAKFNSIYPLFCASYLPAAASSLNHKPVINCLVAANSLDQTQTINLIFQVLALNLHSQDTAGFCRLLQNRKISGYKEEEQARLALQLTLRRRCEATSRIADLKTPMLEADSNHHCPLLADKLNHFEQLRRRRAGRGNTAHWADLFEQQLTLIDWTEPQCHVSENMLFSQWEEVLLQFRDAAQILGEMNCYSAISRLKLLCRQTPTKIPFDPSLNVSLLTTDQAIGFQFTHVWILGMDDRNWPVAAQQQPFLPYALQKQLELPGSSSQLQLKKAQHALSTLIQATSSAVIFSHYQMEEDSKLRVSALVREYEAAQFPIPDSPTEYPQCSIETVEDPICLPLGGNETIKGGASLLTNQANCPFRGFAIHRLKSEPLPQFRAGFDPLARGIALHLALEHFWNIIKSSRKLAELNGDALAEQIDASVHVAVKWLQRSFPETMSPAFSALESNRLIILLGSYVLSEKERSPFNALATEQLLEWENGLIKLKLKVDRVDLLDDGTLALIDYKTGRRAGQITNYRWFDDRPEDLQIPLYQLTLSEQSDNNLSAALICQINAENISYIGATDLEGFHPSLDPLAKVRGFDGTWPELQQKWNAVVASIAAEFSQGLLTVTPTRGSDTCQYCKLAGLCRVDEQLDLNALSNGKVS
jgi:probable DNA repair protein